MTTVLLTSVFKPFGIDSKYGRKEVISEIFYNQLTRYQGIFSVRATYDTFGLHVIASNIDAPTTVLDFPTWERFRKEIAKGYDIVGIGGIIPNYLRIKRMAEEIRAVSPKSKIVLGGFCASAENIEKMLDIDYLCIGDGISFMRDLLGMPEEFEFSHPFVLSKSTRLMGVPLYFKNKHPYIIAGLGCSYGCDFCGTSHFFGKRHIQFLKTGKEVFQVAEKLYKYYGSTSFTVIGDENFLLNEKRANELRDEMVGSGANFNFFVFSSADRITSIGPEKMAEMGIGAVWMGRESKFSYYRKKEGLDLKELVKQMRLHGIKTTLSSILLFDFHTKENIYEDIDDHLDAKPVFSQFGHLCPSPGTPVYDKFKEENRLLPGIAYEDMHGFKRPWYTHPHFTPDEAEVVQREAYKREFERLGPGFFRYLEADIDAYEFLKDHANPNMRKRAERIKAGMKLHTPTMLAIGNLVKGAHRKKLVDDALARLKNIFGSPTVFDYTASMGLTLFGKKEELNYKYLGDVMQPPTKITYYNKK